MRFFTNGTWRPRLSTIEQIATPVGDRCLACGKPIEIDDCGVSMIHMDGSGDAYRPWHLACFRVSLGIEDAQA
jgi:hypothetical protein